MEVAVELEERKGGRGSREKGVGRREKRERGREEGRRRN